ncbi:DUF202 domain-containing protein [Dermatophilaceae bacterium Soc4.6]
MSSPERRWPGWVYDEGDEPDPRFSFANERTFLAWVRTALALLAGGVALQALPLTTAPGLRRVGGAVLAALGVLAVVAGWVRWATAERAMRRHEPMPGFAVAGSLALLLVVAALTVLVVTLAP